MSHLFTPIEFGPLRNAIMQLCGKAKKGHMVNYWHRELELILGNY